MVFDKIIIQLNRGMKGLCNLVIDAGDMKIIEESRGEFLLEILQQMIKELEKKEEELK